MRRSRSPLRTWALAAACAVAAIVVDVAPALASTPPEPPTTTTTATSTSPAVVYSDGVASAADGTFTAAFAVAPTYTPSAEGQPERFSANADEDAQEVARFGLDGFGATADATPTERAQLFIAASGTDVEWLANTPTRLGPDPAAHFIARLTLGDGRDAVVYGLVVADGTRVTYAFATDIGGDDADRSRDFVTSYTSLLPAPTPVAPTTTTTSTTAPISTVAGATTTLSDAPAISDPAPTSTGASTAAAAPTTGAPTTTTTPPIPIGAVTSPDGSWWVTFPDDARIIATASTDNGFAFTEYRAVVGDDTLAVRAVEVPVGYDGDESSVPGFPDADVEGRPSTVGGSPAIISTFLHGDSTVTAVVVHTGGRVVAATYVDDQGDDAAAADEFVDSLGLAA